MADMTERATWREARIKESTSHMCEVKMSDGQTVYADLFADENFGTGTLVVTIGPDVESLGKFEFGQRVRMFGHTFKVAEPEYVGKRRVVRVSVRKTEKNAEQKLHQGDVDYALSADICAQTIMNLTGWVIIPVRDIEK